jgi:hypothetical protein
MGRSIKRSATRGGRGEADGAGSCHLQSIGKGAAGPKYRVPVKKVTEKIVFIVYTQIQRDLTYERSRWLSSSMTALARFGYNRSGLASSPSNASPSSQPGEFECRILN